MFFTEHIQTLEKPEQKETFQQRIDDMRNDVVVKLVGTIRADDFVYRSHPNKINKRSVFETNFL